MDEIEAGNRATTVRLGPVSFKLLGGSADSSGHCAHYCHLRRTLPRPQRWAREVATLKHDEHRRTFASQRSATLDDSR